jgi:hypothetical protein
MNEPRKNETSANERFAEQAKTHFDESVDRLDADTLSRLNQGRHQALAHQSKNHAFGPWFRWIPATGVAAALMITVIMSGPAGVEVISGPATASDLEFLLEEGSLEMFEDLEFYSWLEAADLETNGNVG